MIEPVVGKLGINMGKAGQSIRVAVTAGPASLPIDNTVWLVGQKRVVQGLDKAVEMIEALVAAST